MRLHAWIGICGAAAICGCQVQNTTVVDQAAAVNSAATRSVPRPSQFSPCAAPAGTGPFEHLDRAVSGARVPMPPKAIAEHVSGCAGVRFRIGGDGAPFDISVLAEYPLNYGFADTARAAVAGARWAPRDDTAWRYLIVNMRPGPAAGH